MALAEIRLACNGMITAWNDDAVRLLGSDLEGRSPAELFPGVPGLLDEHLWSHQSGQGFCIAPVAGRDGQTLALVCRPLAQEQAWEAFLLPYKGSSAREGEILSGLMHDLRTPLTTLMGASELLESGHLGKIPQRASGILKVIAGAVQQIARMLEKAAERRSAPPQREHNGPHNLDS
ncbi:MAG: hypothetical protein O7F16_07675 [Acidobacteria bacterium]|nr:hypothetical protein [Acidobacteriota bacterium]